MGDHVGKTWFRISLHNKSSKKSAFQSTMEHLIYLEIRDTFALIMVRPLKYKYNNEAGKFDINNKHGSLSKGVRVLLILVAI